MTRRQALTAAMLLLLATGWQHYGWPLVAVAYADPAAAHRALFYIGSGLSGAGLVALLLWLAPRRLYAVPLALTGLWAMVEWSLVAGCRWARGIENIPSAGLWSGVCSTVVQWPSYLIGAVLGGIAAASILYELTYGHDDQDARQ